MAEEKKTVKAASINKKGGWFRKIPTKIILSPGGIILVLFAVIMEIVDLIPIPFVDQIWEIPIEIIFIIMLITIAKVPLKSCLIPFLIERIPIINDVLPTWVIRMFM